jgi:hypothetical protein
MTSLVTGETTFLTWDPTDVGMTEDFEETAHVTQAELDWLLLQMLCEEGE